MASVGLILKDNRMVMLEDVVSMQGKMVDSIKADKEHICKKRPSNCPKCSSNSIVGVEVIGSYSGALFWECDECDCTVLRFREETTEKYLQLAKGLWTNPNDWGFVPRSEFN